ncbi:MAG: hypothetical protein ACM3U2_05780 [Deltaproteobacteria bacterium]
MTNSSPASEIKRRIESSIHLPLGPFGDLTPDLLDEHPDDLGRRPFICRMPEGELQIASDRRRLLGRTNISTSQRYLHLDDRELAEAQDLVRG